MDPVERETLEEAMLQSVIETSLVEANLGADLVISLMLDCV